MSKRLVMAPDPEPDPEIIARIAVLTSAQELLEKCHGSMQTVEHMLQIANWIVDYDD